MGLVRLEYMIFEGDEKLLKSFRAEVVDILNKEEELSSDLVGPVVLGANGHNSLIIHPHGWNGGWGAYQDCYDSIMNSFFFINHKEKQRYLKSKDANDWEKSIYLTTFMHGDDGYKIELEDLVERLRDGCNPDVGFIDHNDRFGDTVDAVKEDVAEMFRKQGEEEWERKQRKIATKMVELEELAKGKKK